MQFLNKKISDQQTFSFLMALQFFLIIAVFWIFKPLKKALFIQAYDDKPFEIVNLVFSAAQTELVAKSLNMLVALGAMVLFVRLSKRFRRSVFLLALSSLVMAILLVVAVSLKFELSWSVWAFYLFGDLFNMLMVAGFFAFLNDSVKSEQAKKLYGPIVFGGVLGGAAGSTLVKGLALQMPLAFWFAIAFFMVGLTAILARVAERYIPDGHMETASPAPGHTTSTQLLASGIALLKKSRYILAIGMLVGLYEITSTLVDYQFTSAVEKYLDGDNIKAFFSNVYLAMNLVSLTVQLFLTGAIMQKRGVKPALLVLPAALLGGSLAFVIMPVLFVGALLCIFDNGLNYSINQSAKESLYVKVPAALRYKAKGFIDIFVQRAAKSVGICATFLLSFALPASYLAVLTVLLVSVWLAVAVWAGRYFDEDLDTVGDNGLEQGGTAQLLPNPVHPS